ncbi:MAG: carboxypeptidase-like regulatory domain-containing protein [Bacteroidales bacterium]|nr:carboxypeptidase-like regulatory domain-containing protein [Bacteroidales bacterium]
MKTGSFMRSLALVLMVVGFTSMPGKASVRPMLQDTVFTTFSGTVINDETRDPIVFVNVYLIGSSLGTVTNAEGEFILKVPLSEMNGKVRFSYLGYQNVDIALATLNPEDNIIRLRPTAVNLEEVTIRTEDPVQLIRIAQNNVRRNYATNPQRLVGFYRETVKENRNYVVVAEAVLDVFKASYGNDFQLDRVSIFRGRKSGEVKKMDTINFKLQGGPKTSFLLDLVKNPGGILAEDYIEYYDFWFAGFEIIDDRNNYVIGFDQRNDVDMSLYKGKIYIDAKNMAFSRFEFELSDKEIETAASELVRKKPMDLKIEVISGNYLVNYRMVNNTWYINHVRSDLVFETQWKKKRHNATYVTTLEMAVTDRDSMNVEKSRYRSQVRTNDILADDVSYYEDEDFWGDYNYIKPDESIESVIRRLSRKLRWETLDEIDE